LKYPLKDVLRIFLNIRGKLNKTSHHTLSSPEKTEATITIEKALERRDPRCLNDSRRARVALSRAQSGLIIIAVINQCKEKSEEDSTL